MTFLGGRGGAPRKLERKKRDIHKKAMNIKRYNKNTPFRIKFFYNIIKPTEKET
jgi:hypothetical protein